MKNTVDISLAGVALTSPAWMSFIEAGLGMAALAGGVVLLFIRIALGIQEWRKRDKKD